MKAKRALVTGAQLAKILQVDSSRISQLKLAHGMPTVRTAGRELFDPAVVIPWLAERKLGGLNGKHAHVDGTVVTGDPDAARTRRLEAAASLAELQLARQRGEVIAIADVMRMLARCVATARAQLLALPTKCAPLVAAEDTTARCERILEAAVHEALEQLAVSLPVHGAPVTIVQ